MVIRERWRAWPWGVRLAYVAAGYFALCFGLRVAIGPHLFLNLAGCLSFLLLVPVILLGILRLMVYPLPERWVLPPCLATGCLVYVVSAPGTEIDLHLISRVYLAGGPATINDWGQELIREHPEAGDERAVGRDKLPPGVQTYLSGAVSVGGTIWRDDPCVRIELGGGFYHYGLIVNPPGSDPPAKWWQRALGWPPEVAIYRE